MKTTKWFVDANKNPKKFRREALVEVETEKSKVGLPIHITEKKHTASTGTRLVRQPENRITGQQKHEHNPEHNHKREKCENPQ